MAIAYKRLAATCPSNTTETQLYLVAVGTMVNGMLRIVNLTANSVTYSVAHTDTAGTAANEDWLRKTSNISPNDTHEISIHAAENESIRVVSGTNSAITFHLSGQVITA